MGLACTFAIGQCEPEFPREKKAQKLFDKATDGKSKSQSAEEKAL